jgi:hypothetical protein
MKVRHVIPLRCDAPAIWYAPSNGYRLCRDCMDRGRAPAMLLLSEAGPHYGTDRCDWPTDGLGAARYIPRTGY